jgi:hypothetical protein
MGLSHLWSSFPGDGMRQVQVQVQVHTLRLRHSCGQNLQINLVQWSFLGTWEFDWDPEQFYRKWIVYFVGTVMYCSLTPKSSWNDKNRRRLNCACTCVIHCKQLEIRMGQAHKQGLTCILAGPFFTQNVTRSLSIWCQTLILWNEECL